MFKLKELKYPYDALEPYIDTKTMETHHKKHLAKYVENLNKAVENLDIPSNISLETLLKNLNAEVPIDIYWAIRNNGGGVLNHNMFFSFLSPNGAKDPSGRLEEDLKKTFGSLEEFKIKFNECAMKRFGSGWAWLLIDKYGKLFVKSSSNQDSPVHDGYHIVLCLDVWEHAYYLNYLNNRKAYVEAFWNIVDWDYVSERYADIRNKTSF